SPRVVPIVRNPGRFCCTLSDTGAQRPETSMPTLTDRHGLALSSRSPSAVERYDHGLDLQLSLNAGGVEGLASAVEADPEFALGHAGLAFARWYRSDIPAARASLQQAQTFAE